MNRRIVVWSLLVVSVISFKAIAKIPDSSTSINSNEDLQKIYIQNKLEQEGRSFIKKGLYDEAVEKFKLADNPSSRVEGYHRSLPKGLLAKAYKLKGNYDEALSLFDGLLAVIPNQQSWLDEKLELEAMIKARDTNSNEPVYEHINYLLTKYEDQVPPNAGAYSDVVSSAIIRLYDHIADYDAGIAFVNACMKRCADGVTCMGEERKIAYTSKHPYFPIYKAFMEDQKLNRASCVNAKPGEVCIGKATQALIQSDYFPW